MHPLLDGEGTCPLGKGTRILEVLHPALTSDFHLFGDCFNGGCSVVVDENVKGLPNGYQPIQTSLYWPPLVESDIRLIGSLLTKGTHRANQSVRSFLLYFVPDIDAASSLNALLDFSD